MLRNVPLGVYAQEARSWSQIKSKFVLGHLQSETHLPFGKRNGNQTSCPKGQIETYIPRQV